MSEEMIKKQDSSYFATERIGKLIAKFAVPCVVSMLVNSLYNIVDQIFIGQGVGYLGNAATNVAFPLVTISLAIALLIGDGCAAYFSLKLGEGKNEEAARGVGNTITMLTIAGILFFIFGMLLLKPMLHLFGATETVFPYAEAYTRVIIIGLPFVLVGAGLNSVVRADGSPRFSMAAMIVGAIINTILDPIFIFIFGWGVSGAAFATILGQIATFVITMFYLVRFKNITLKKEYLKLKGKICKMVCSLGISSCVNQLAVTVVVIVTNNVLAYYGAMSPYGAEIPLSAIGIVMKVNQILMSILIGIGVGSQPIIGYNYGAQNYDRVKKTFFMSAGIATVFACIGFLLFQFCTQGIVNIFGQEDALYNDFALRTFRVFLAVCFLNGFQMVTSIFFQAIGKPLKATLISLSRQILFLIPLFIILPAFTGVTGALYAGPIADAMAFLLALVLVMFEMKHLNLLAKTGKLELETNE